MDGFIMVEDLDKIEVNKVLVVFFVEDVLMGKNLNKIMDYISVEIYYQYNLDIKDGLQGIVEVVEYLIVWNNMFQYIKIYKVLGEGNFVLMVSEG